MSTCNHFPGQRDCGWCRGDAERARALHEAARGNSYCDHPGITYCGGCVTSIEGEDMLADLREAGWDLVKR